MEKKRVICLCTTYFQLITAIQMRKTMFSEDFFSVVMTDGSNKAEQVSERLKEAKIFDEVFFVTKARGAAADFKSPGRKIGRLFNYFFKGSYVSYLTKPYDLFLSYNFNWYAFMMFNALSIDNRQIKVAKYEEGLISYFVDDHRFELTYFKRLNKIKKLIHQPVMFDSLREFYCFYPKFYEGGLSTVQIPPIAYNDSWFRDTLCFLFDVDADKLVYDRKYIYFASMLDSELANGEDGEIEIVRSLAETVGSENILVKLHPRENNPQRYRDLGVTIDANSDIPFEVIQLVRDFSDNVFITCISGSVINFASILPKRSKTYFTYDLLPEKIRKLEKIDTVCTMYDKAIAKMNEVTGTDDFTVLYSKEQMEEEMGAARR